jgi:putative acetyltransferase
LSLEPKFCDKRVYLAPEGANLAADGGMSIVEVEGGEDLRQARRLLAEYFAFLEAVPGERRRREVAALPGEYAHPGGRLLLARDGCEAAGCVALRRLQPGSCELKRLDVRPRFRGAGLGSCLTVAAITAAREMGYERVLLHTLPAMTQAHALYGRLGFHEIPAFREIPLPGVIYLELDLAALPGSPRTPETPPP